MRADIEKKRSVIIQIAARHGARNVRVFGSVARHEDEPGSDLDLLVDTGPDVSSWFPAGLILDLQNALGRPVDVVTEKGLNPLLRDRVLREAAPL